ncbi:hypothetical protein PIB30_079023 [Stylosanthes scabra]|uniref:Uncharacterized protein n=1 Tax=Stylosanthes scabra TaxID=79078 RepID=A0ABU6SRT7_9FABA|nr:hypothetical protein [Stylosanthes scabra]
MLKKHERSEELRATRRRERKQVPSAPVNSADRSKTVQKSEREINVERHKGYLGKFEVETSNIPAEKAKGEQRDNSVTKGYDSKRKIGEANGGSDDNQIKRIRMTTEASKDKGESRHNSVSEGNDSKRKFRGNDGKGHDSKLKSGGTSGGNDKKIKKRRRVIKSSKSGINSPSNCAAAESNVQVSTVAPPEQSMPMPLQVLLPEPNGETNGEPYDSKRKIDGGSDDNQIKRIRRTTEASKDKGESRHNSVSEGNEGHDSKLKSGGTSGGNDKKIKKRRRVIKSSKSGINSPSNCAAAESNVQVSTVAPPEQSMPMPLQVLLPEPNGEPYDSKRKIDGGSDDNQNKRIRRTTEASKDKGESRHNSVSEGNDSKQKFRGNDGSNHKNNIKQLRDIASSKPEGELRHKSVAEGHDSKLKSGGTSGGNDKKIKKRRRVIKSSKSDINSPSNCAAAESNVQVSTVAPPEQSMPMPLQVLLPEPAVGSNSETQIQPLVLDKLEHQSSEAIVNHKSLSTTDETNVQPSSSMSMELDAPVNSSTNNEISNGNCKVEEKMEVLDISPLSNNVESTVQDPTAAPPQKPTPLWELSLSPLEGSNSEPVIQPFVQVELEHLSVRRQCTLRESKSYG